MCLSNAYVKRGDSAELVMEKVASFTQEESQVILTDLMGRQKTVPGTVQAADLLANSITIA